MKNRKILTLLPICAVVFYACGNVNDRICKDMSGDEAGGEDETSVTEDDEKSRKHFWDNSTDNVSDFDLGTSNTTHQPKKRHVGGFPHNFELTSQPEPLVKTSEQSEIVEEITISEDKEDEAYPWNHPPKSKRHKWWKEEKNNLYSFFLLSDCGLFHSLQRELPNWDGLKTLVLTDTSELNSLSVTDFNFF